MWVDFERLVLRWDQIMLIEISLLVYLLTEVCVLFDMRLMMYIRVLDCCMPL
jgi:hypothetical protein